MERTHRANGIRNRIEVFFGKLAWSLQALGQIWLVGDGGSLARLGRGAHETSLGQCPRLMAIGPNSVWESPDRLLD